MALVIPAEVRELSSIARAVGCDDPLRYLEDLSWVDTDRLKAAGENVWGAGGEKVAAQVMLEEHAERLTEMLLSSVQDRWTGEAYEQFVNYMATIERAIDDEAAALQVVGSALVDVAESFEVRWYEIVGYILGVIGLILGIVGAVIAVYTGITGVGAVVGLIVGIVGVIIGAVALIIAGFASILPRLEAMTEAMQNIGPRIHAATAVDELGGDDIPGAFPGDHTAWEPRTEDPYS
ncbi:hypothetical protein GCM10022225_66500 [Plantactinospora mayteni]|uniref:WXG100 family type VII secretion target n=1 Tax=Plantactinospora mayteni TaxID=566021 RepID=A0ABQ4EPI8_9ACTN|nr:hypothetical protein [Plantactinospora mayteni]GIG96569.1 hypothetical protein Pma05_31420 [Plantactinospora mayteni]